MEPISPAPAIHADSPDSDLIKKCKEDAAKREEELQKQLKKKEEESAARIKKLEDD